MQLYSIHERREDGEPYAIRHRMPTPEIEGLVRVDEDSWGHLTTEQISYLEDKMFDSYDPLNDGRMNLIKRDDWDLMALYF